MMKIQSSKQTTKLHLLSASVWFMPPIDTTTMNQLIEADAGVTWSHGILSISMRSRISSGMAIDGWVSFSWIATWTSSDKYKWRSMTLNIQISHDEIGLADNILKTNILVHKTNNFTARLKNSLYKVAYSIKTIILRQHISTFSVNWSSTGITFMLVVFNNEMQEKTS